MVYGTVRAHESWQIITRISTKYRGSKISFLFLWLAMIESKHKLRKVEKRFGLSDHYFHITMTTKVILKWLENLLRRLSPTPEGKLSRFLQFDFDIFVEYRIVSEIKFSKWWLWWRCWATANQRAVSRGKPTWYYYLYFPVVVWPSLGCPRIPKIFGNYVLGFHSREMALKIYYLG